MKPIKRKLKYYSYILSILVLFYSCYNPNASFAKKITVSLKNEKATFEYLGLRDSRHSLIINSPNLDNKMNLRIDGDLVKSISKEFDDSKELEHGKMISLFPDSEELFVSYKQITEEYGLFTIIDNNGVNYEMGVSGNLKNPAGDKISPELAHIFVVVIFIAGSFAFGIIATSCLILDRMEQQCKNNAVQACGRDNISSVNITVSMGIYGCEYSCGYTCK